ncbi:MAG: exodeoxyribonuclease III [Rickettsiaceae bacterium]|nr:exodeoxyribonuclease III [Rickettsiaceae bacterium]
MRVATWNINSVRIRLDIIKKLEMLYNIDVLLLQETKTVNHSFPSEFFARIGFTNQYFEGEKSYNGVAIVSKIPFDDYFSLSFCNKDKRHVAAMIQGIEVHNFYWPAGGDIPDVNINPKFQNKLQYIQEFKDWFYSNRNTKQKILLAGDLNIAPHEHDVWSSKALKNEVSHTDIERSMMMDVIKSFGWIDVARHIIGDFEDKRKIYSWWSYRNIDWQKSNRGRRLDHIWVSDTLKLHYSNFKIIKDARDWQMPSDHVPVLIDLAI